MRSASLKIPFPSFLCVSMCVFVLFLFLRCLHTHVLYTNKTFTNKNARNMSLLHSEDISNIFVLKLRTHTHCFSLSHSIIHTYSCGRYIGSVLSCIILYQAVKSVMTKKSVLCEPVLLITLWNSVAFCQRALMPVISACEQHHHVIRIL